MRPSDISTGLVARVVVVTAAVVGTIYFLYLILSVIGLVLIAIFFALALAPAVNWLDQRKVPRSLAILLCYIGIAAGIFGIGLLIVPPLITGVNGLSNDLPGYVHDLRTNETFRNYDDRYHITNNLQQQSRELPSKLGAAAGTLRDVTVGVFSKFIELFSILVITYFLLMDGGRMTEFIFRNLPEERERRLRSVSGDATVAIAGYVFGNFVISILAGLVTYATLEILGVPFAVPLAILFGFFDLVPLVGATIGGILIGIVVAFVDFPISLIVWVAVLIMYQQVENNVIQPFIYGKTVQLHPLIVIIAILIGASLLGILGALLAIPAAATLQSIVRDYWRAYRGEFKSEPEPEAAAGEAG